jgi:hypothetical protein
MAVIYKDLEKFAPVHFQLTQTEWAATQGMRTRSHSGCLKLHPMHLLNIQNSIGRSALASGDTAMLFDAAEIKSPEIRNFGM